MSTPSSLPHLESSEPTSTPGVSAPDWQRFCRTLERQEKFGLEWGLERMQRALELEESPSRDYPVVAVAGTNGKGHTSACLSSILQTHDLEVGLFTSPHILDVRERFRVNGRLPSRQIVYREGRRVLSQYAHGGRGPVQLTYFELTALIAARVFRQCDVDLGIFEVGLGGRLDAVNALDLDMSVITPIDRDHTGVLGETLEAIAAEKAGIFRDDCPAVIGRQPHVEALETLRIHASDGALEPDHHAPHRGEQLQIEGEYAIEPPSSWTSFQRDNAVTALRAASRYLGETFEMERARHGLHATRWPGRMDRRAVEPDVLGGEQSASVLFDTAHNPGAARALVEALDRQDIAIDAILVGGMDDKDLDGLVGPLAELAPMWGSVLPRDRSADSARLRDVLSVGKCVEVGPVDEMFRQAGRAASRRGRSGRLLVTGSLFLIGACFEQLGIPSDALVTYRRNPAEP